MTANQFETSKALASISSLFDQCEVPYFLVGSFASGFHGEFRATNDIDIVCKLTEQKLSSFINHAAPTFICDEHAILKEIKRAGSYNILHEETFVKVDLFFKLGELEREEFSRKEKIIIPQTEQHTFVATVEYNILAKLRWYKKSNFQLNQQMRDIQSMIRLNEESLDRAFIKEWAKKLNLSDLLAKELDAHY